MIRKQGNKYVVVAKTGRKMGTYNTRKEAEERLRQVEIMKNINKK
jgi:hypothetical protein